MDVVSKKLPKIKKAQLPWYARRAADRVLCQGLVPRELLMAARDEWTQRGLDTGVFLTWALTQYLQAVNAERAAQVFDAMDYSA